MNKILKRYKMSQVHSEVLINNLEKTKSKKSIFKPIKRKQNKKFLNQEALKTVDKYTTIVHTETCYLGVIEQSYSNIIKFIISSNVATEYFSLEKDNVDNIYIANKSLFSNKHNIKILFKTSREHNNLFFGVPNKDDAQKCVLALSNLLT